MDYFDGTKADWLKSFRNDFLPEILSQYPDHLSNMNLSLEDFDYLNDIDNPERERLLLIIADYMEVEPSLFLIGSSQDLSLATLSLIFGYTAGLKDAL